MLCCFLVMDLGMVAQRAGDRAGTQACAVCFLAAPPSQFPSVMTRVKCRDLWTPPASMDHVFVWCTVESSPLCMGRHKYSSFTEGFWRCETVARDNSVCLTPAQTPVPCRHSLSACGHPGSLSYRQSLNLPPAFFFPQFTPPLFFAELAPWWG